MIKDSQGRDLNMNETAEKIRNRLANYLQDFILMLIYAAGAVPSHHIRRFFYRTSGMKIGKGSAVHTFFRCFEPGGIKIGQDTIIGDHAFLDGRGGLDIGNHVDIASCVMVYTSQHDVDSEYFRAESKAVSIGDYVFIGPRAVILPGVTIGKGAVIGAGSIVTKHVPPFQVVAGAPAQFVRERKNKNPRYRLGRARLFQ